MNKSPDNISSALWTPAFNFIYIFKAGVYLEGVLFRERNSWLCIVLMIFLILKYHISIFIDFVYVLYVKDEHNGSYSSLNI